MNKLEKYKKEIGFRISILVLLCMVALLSLIHISEPTRRS